uniref:Uncharacterized protein n=1 Tax=Rhizophora mucronata TaxID=61149 RepID=A0A2P2QVR5_RHIMU
MEVLPFLLKKLISRVTISITDFPYNEFPKKKKKERF